MFRFDSNRILFASNIAAFTLELSSKNANNWDFELEKP